MKIWLDDVRLAPEGQVEWVECTTGEQAIALISMKNVSFVSFDHDLGTGCTGYDVAKFIEEAAHLGKIKDPINYSVHSANPVGSANIKRAMDSAWQVWSASARG